MKHQTVTLDTLTQDPRNVRKHSERNIEAVKASLKKFGQQKPIVVQEDGTVIAGNATLEAARALGWEKIEIVRTKLIGEAATAFAIADNRTAELAMWDEAALFDQLKAMTDADLLFATGFKSPEEALATMKLQAEPPTDFPEHNEDISTDHQCPRCEYRWS